MRLLDRLPLGGACSCPPFRTAAGQAPLPRPSGTEPQIQDNSFLLEEAYNQEAGVVQTIQTYTRVAGTGDWAYTLTQEWPVPDEKNQLSFTIPIQGLSGPIGVARGTRRPRAELPLPARRQRRGARSPSARAPTLLVPTGDCRRALGSGGFGLQVSVPLSVVLSRHFVAHTNVGATLILSAKDAEGDRANLTNLNAGQSLVWLAHPNVNVLVEAVIATNETIGGGGVLIRQTAEAVSPGRSGRAQPARKTSRSSPVSRFRSASARAAVSAACSSTSASSCPSGTRPVNRRQSRFRTSFAIVLSCMKDVPS